MTTPSTTLTAAREAERAAHEKAARAADLAAAATKHREQVEKEEKERLTVTSGSIKWRLASNGKHFEWSENGRDFNEGVDVPHIALLASLLPRKPVAISDEMVSKALEAYFAHLDVPLPSMRAALEAVASDLTAPVAVAAPRLGTPQGEPDGYVMIDNEGDIDRYDSLARALEHARQFNAGSLTSRYAPYHVYALHRAPDETEGAAND